MFWPILEAITRELESCGDLSKVQEEWEERLRAQFGAQVPVNVHTNDREAIVSAELAGVKPEAMKVTVEGRVLTLEGERQAEELGPDSVTIRQERSTGHFRRQVRLPFEVSADRVTARHHQGVLTVTLPRADGGPARSIRVEAD